MTTNDQHSAFPSFSTSLAKSDALSPGERVQFHLLRHYCSWVELSPDDPIRVRRLAAYAKNPVSGEHGLDIGSFQKYSARDGPAFVYTTSLNSHIWRDKAASAAMAAGNFPGPEDSREVYQNRDFCRIRDAKSSLSDRTAPEGDDSAASQTLDAVEKLKEALSGNHRELNAKLRGLRRWFLWGAIVLIGLLIFEH